MPTPDEDQIERIRGAYRLFNERHLIDDQVFAADVEWHNAPELPGAGVHRGVDAVLRDILRQQEAWGEARYEPTEVIPAGDDRYVVLLDVKVRGAASGAWASIEGAHILELRDGKVVRVRAFVHQEQALDTAGVAR